MTLLQNGTSAVNQDNLVDEATKLITDGDINIRVDSRHRNITLVIAKTGSGKTTLTTFLTNPNSLEAYDAIDRILIRDTDRKIINSSIVSQTIFPNLMIDTTNNNAFYDLPGFSDTRSASIEIANAWFMKKVADHADKVKLLFVVNHSSVRSGESRTDFKDMLEHATDLIKNPEKFKSSIALVATKVEIRQQPEKIIEGIAAFLEVCKKDLSSVISDGVKRRAAQSILDALVVKDSHGRYSRIAYFRQPEKAGLVSTMSEFMKQKDYITNIINNIPYTEKCYGDFGLSVSPAAMNLITKIVNKINGQIGTIMETIGSKISENFQNRVTASRWEDLGTLLQEVETFRRLADSLVDAPDRGHFYQQLQQITDLSLTSNLTVEFNEIQQRYERLTFLEHMQRIEFRLNFLNWSNPIQNSIKVLQGAVQLKTEDFDKKMQVDISCICVELLTSLVARNEQVDSNKEKSKTLTRITKELNSMNGKLAGSKSVNTFVQLVQIYMNMFDSTVNTTHLVQFKEDVTFGPSSPVSLLSWVAPFEMLLKELRQIEFNAEIDALQDSNQEDAENFKKMMDKIEADYQAQAEDQDRRIANLETDKATQAKSYEEAMARLNVSNKEQLDMLRSVIEQNQAALHAIGKGPKCVIL